MGNVLMICVQFDVRVPEIQITDFWMIDRPCAVVCELLLLLLVLLLIVEALMLLRNFVK